MEPERRALLIRLLAENDSVAGFEAQVYRKDGQTIWISINARAVKDTEGNTNYIEGTIEEITERKAAEAALKQSEERYRALLGESAEAIFITSRDGKVVDVNKAALELFGFTKDDAIGSDVGERFLDPADRRRFREAVGNSSVSGFDVRLLKMDESVINVVMSAVRMLDEAGTSVGVRGTLHEAGGAKRSGDSQRTDELGRFTAAIARELDKPLNAIASTARRLMRLDVEPVIRQRAREISAEAARTKKVLDSVLLATQSEPLKPDIVDISELLASVVSSYSMDSALGRTNGTVFKLNRSSDMEYVTGDQALLEMVFKNLIENAREARDPSKHQVSIDIDCERRDTMVQISIKDDGRGIPKADLGRVFELFFTANGDGRHGMGLSVCRGIVKQHNGQISMESEPGKWSVVTIELPVAHAPTSQTTAPAAPAEEPATVTPLATSEKLTATPAEATPCPVETVRDMAASYADWLPEQGDLFSGEIDLVIAPTPQPMQFLKFYQWLHDLANVRVGGFTGVLGGEKILNVSFPNPIPASMIFESPLVMEASEVLSNDQQASADGGSLTKAAPWPALAGHTARRFRIVLKS